MCVVMALHWFLWNFRIWFSFPDWTTSFQKPISIFKCLAELKRQQSFESQTRCKFYFGRLGRCRLTSFPIFFCVGKDRGVVNMPYNLDFLLTGRVLNISPGQYPLDVWAQWIDSLYWPPSGDNELSLNGYSSFSFTLKTPQIKIL